MGPSIIIKAIKWHLKDFIGLPKAIPGSVVSLIYLNSMPKKWKRKRKKAESKLATFRLNKVKVLAAQMSLTLFGPNGL